MQHTGNNKNPLQAILRVAVPAPLYSSFDYLPPDVIDGTSTRIEAQNMFTEVKSYGESFRLGFEPGNLASFLIDLGWMVKEDISASELKSLYFNGNSVQRQVTPIFRFVHAKEAR